MNLQGDEPLIRPGDVETLVSGMLADRSVAVGTLYHRIMAEEAKNPDAVKVVLGDNSDALCFSRAPIPYPRGLAEAVYFKHVGVYAYRPGALAAYQGWPTGPVVDLVGLEKLRFIENGRRVLCVEVEARGRQFWELNNPEDVPRIEAMMAAMGHS